MSPTRILNQALNKLSLARGQIYHSALCMTDERNRARTAHGNGIRDLEFTVTKIRPAGTDDEGKIVRNVKMLPIIHTHSYQQPGRGITLVWPTQVMVFEQKAYGVIPVLCGNVVSRCDRK